MTEETRIIIKNELIKSADEAFKGPDGKLNRMTYILGARKLLSLLLKHDVLEFDPTDSLFNDLDLNKVKL